MEIIQKIIQFIIGLLTGKLNNFSVTPELAEKRKLAENLPISVWEPELIEIADIFNYSKIESMYIEKGFPFETEINHVNICGIRNRKRNLHDDILCDIICIVWIGETGERCANQFQATTRPGEYYCKRSNWLNPNGAAIVIPGFHANCWIVGAHRGKYYPCLIGRKGITKPIMVARDFNENGEIEKDETVMESWAINCHFGWWGEKIVRSSAGCQVTKNETSNKKFMDIVMQDTRYIANNKFLYSYGLFVY
ncbi:MAG: hypothetical protein ABIJ97_03210 [Bacteroidota bacterium]